MVHSKLIDKTDRLNRSAIGGFKKIVYEPSKITIWPQFINCLNDKELFVNFFQLTSFTQGNFTNFDKKWPKSDS